MPAGKSRDMTTTRIVARMATSGRLIAHQPGNEMLTPS